MREHSRFVEFLQTIVKHLAYLAERTKEMKTHFFQSKPQKRKPVCPYFQTHCSGLIANLKDISPQTQIAAFIWDKS
jgi:hypothetical protein|tara:strand:+ start:105 stop:332 length:228 start_codon:yes stop_codon:yes gene_type:complete